jgi:hypothetical protein
MNYYAKMVGGANGLALLRDIIKPSYRLKKNEVTSFSFSLFADDPALPDMVTGMQCILYRDGVERISGILTGRDFSKSPYQFNFMSDSILLNRMICPSEWHAWAKMPLHSAVEDLLLDFVTQAVNTRTGWEASPDKSNIDTSTEPGTILLSKNGTRYNADGYIVLEFDLGTNVTRLDRIRWAEEQGEKVKVTCQYRVSTDGISWPDWSTRAKLESTAPSVDGVTTYETGRYVQVRLNLHTDDTQAENQNKDPQGYSPLVRGVEVVARVPGLITAGSIEETTITLDDLTYSRENALRILQDWCSKYGYEFRVNSDRQLVFGKSLGERTSITFRRGEGINISKVSDSADEIQNVLTCYGKGEGPGQLRIELRDEESIATYGTIPGTFEDSAQDTVEKLTAAGQAELDKRSKPKNDFVIVGIDPDDYEDFRCGDVVTVIDPTRGEVLSNLTISDEERSLSGTENVTLALEGASLDNFAEVLTRRSIGTTGQVAQTPPTPKNLNVTGTFRGVALRWECDGAAEGFVVEHSSDGQTFTAIGRPVGRSFLHTPLSLLESHYYRVYALNGNYASGHSSILQGYPQDATTVNLPDIVSKASNGTITIFRQATPPTGAEVDDYWFDTDDSNKLYKHNGTTWEVVADAALVSSALSAGEAQKAANTAQATADGTVEIFYNASTSPPAGKVGDLWLVSDQGNALKRHNGATTGDPWEAVDDARIAKTITDLGTLGTEVDKKITSYYNLSAPTTANEGDLWFDTSDKNKLYRASRTGTDLTKTNGWAEVRDSDIATALTKAQTALDTKTSVYYQTKDPNTDTPRPALVKGDMWIYQTTATPKQTILKQWNGTGWDDITDPTIQAAWEAAGTAKATADRKIQCFVKATAPLGTTPDFAEEGDLWIDTSTAGKNALKVLLSGVWTAKQDQQLAEAIGAAQATANGKNTVYVTVDTTEPTPPAGGFQKGDLWYCPDSKTLGGYIIYTYDGGWANKQIGTTHIAKGAVSNSEMYILNDPTGFFTTSTFSVDVPDYTLTIPLEEDAQAIIMASCVLQARLTSGASGEAVGAYLDLLLNGAIIQSGQIMGQWSANSTVTKLQSTVTMVAMGTLSAGDNIIKVQLSKSFITNGSAGVGNRSLQVMILKR